MLERKVNNLPKPELIKKYVVARWADGELWFWGTWDDNKRANEVAEEIGGIVVENL